MIKKLLETLHFATSVTRDDRTEFCVNLSSQSVALAHFPDYLQSQFLAGRARAEQFIFEIAERDALEHRKPVEYLASRLHDLGCRIALDNSREGLGIFGTIRRCPISCVKIDAALTSQVACDRRSAHVVRELAEVTADIGIETVGEQVETEVIKSTLSDLKIDFAQGFHLSRPRPLAQVVR